MPCGPAIMLAAACYSIGHSRWQIMTRDLRRTHGSLQGGRPLPALLSSLRSLHQLVEDPESVGLLLQRDVHVHELLEVPVQHVVQMEGLL